MDCKQTKQFAGHSNGLSKKYNLNSRSEVELAGSSSTPGAKSPLVDTICHTGNCEKAHAGFTCFEQDWRET